MSVNGPAEVPRRFAGDEKAPAPGAAKSPTLDYASLANFVVQASLARAATGLWAWQRELQIGLKYALDVVHTFHRMDVAQRKQAQGMLIDHIRGYFREVAELGEQESHRLQTELERIAATVWPTSARQRHQRYRRRWHVKS